MITNITNKLKQIIRHNQFFTTALVIVICMSIWMIGCESTTQSPLRPETKVTRAELQDEIAAFQTKVEQAVTDLDRQDAFKAKLAEIGIAVAQGGTINPVGAGISLLGILGLGAVADNRKKDSIIKTLKNGQKETV
jgi:hypothetical protein